MPRSATLVVLFALWSGAALAIDSHDTLLLAQPDITNEHHLRLLRRVGCEREAAQPPPDDRRGQETLPHFSPDGPHAFSGNYDGNIDVYVVPIRGGSPKRLTWHSADDLVEGFDHRGRVVFSSQSDVQTARDVHLFAIDPNAALPERLPIPRGVDADISPDGRTIAYAQTPPQPQWKAYRGGTVSRIALMSFADHGLKRVPQPRVVATTQRWDRRQVSRFRPQRDSTASCDPASSEVRQGLPTRTLQRERNVGVGK